MKNENLDQAIKALGEQINADINSLSDVTNLGEDENKKINNNIKSEVESYKELILLKSKLANMEEENKNKELDLKNKETELSIQAQKNGIEIEKIKSLEIIENNKNATSKWTSKTTAVSSIIGTGVVLLTTVINVMANRRNAKTMEKLAIMSMNLEYVDNGITPRAFNDAKHSLEGFLKK